MSAVWFVMEARSENGSARAKLYHQDTRPTDHGPEGKRYFQFGPAEVPPEMRAASLTAIEAYFIPPASDDHTIVHESVGEPEAAPVFKSNRDEAQPEQEVMLDIETLGTRPGCVVVTACAVVFEPDGTIVAHQQVRFNVLEQLLAGLDVDPGTLEFWRSQSDAAKVDLAYPAQNSIVNNLELLGFYIQKGCRVWAQGSDFDFPILRHLYEAYHVDLPWKFYEVRDTRTAYEMAKEDGFSRQDMDAMREGTHHTALDDCLHQIKCLTEARKCIARGGPSD